MTEVPREELEGDVLFVGGGPAGLAGAIRLKELLKAHNEAAKAAGRPALDLSNAVLDKALQLEHFAFMSVVSLSLAISTQKSETGDAAWSLKN